MKLKKLLTVLLSVMLVFAVLPFGTFTVSATTSGTTGDCTWTLEGTVLTISGNGEMADYKLSGQYYQTKSDAPWGTGIARVIINEGVTRIGNNSFFDCTSLSKITIPKSVTSIGSGVFGTTMGVFEQIKVYITDINTWCSIDFNDYFSNPMPYTGILYLNNKPHNNLEIYDGLTEIKARTFCGADFLESISFPDSVVSVGSDAFKNCKNLENVYIKDINSWCNIDFCDKFSNPMYYANNLYVNNELINDLRIPSGTRILGAYQFYNCQSIKNIFIPKSILSVNQDAFLGCSGIENIYYEGTATEWASVAINSGNYYFENANVCYNSTEIPDGITSITISKLPDKVQYIKNIDELNLAGGVLTVNYDDGATKDIALTELNAEGFNNSVLGKQTITVKYCEFETSFEIEIIPRQISFIALSVLPTRTMYTVGDSIDLTGGKLAVGYPDGTYEICDLTEDMVTGYDANKVGTQILTVIYEEHWTKFTVEVLRVTDLNCDGNVNASDITIIRKELLNIDLYNEKYDMNGNGTVDIRDLIYLKKQVAGIN